MELRAEPCMRGRGASHDRFDRPSCLSQRLDERIATRPQTSVQESKRRMKSTLSLVALALVATLAGCSSSGGTNESDELTGTVRQHVINGKPSDNSQDSVILLVHYDPGSNGFGQCTGT